jgi:lysophospholipase L1-like esterase
VKLFFICCCIIVFGIAVVIFTVKTPAHSAKKIFNGSYIAMGDSVSAGVGLLENSDSSACDRSNQSYPYVTANDLSYKLENLSCSGATLTSGILGSQEVNDYQEKPELDALFSQSKPKLITITIGANDLHWIDLLGKCYDTECGTAEDKEMISQNIISVATNMNELLQKISAHYVQSPPLVIVTGYYQLYPTTTKSSCSDLSGIDATELSFMQQVITQMNETLQSSVKAYSFAKFVPVNFSGHELCTEDPWIQGLTDQEPFHPTAQGQKEYAKQIITTVNNIQ